MAGLKFEGGSFVEVMVVFFLWFVLVIKVFYIVCEQGGRFIVKLGVENILWVKSAYLNECVGKLTVILYSQN